MTITILEKLRREHDLTQKELAVKIGVANNTISQWETGLYKPPTEKLIKLSKLFNVSIDYLLEHDIQGDEDPA